MSILSELQERVKTALKAGDKEQVSVLRMIICELQKEAKERQAELDTQAELQVLKKELKRRQESVAAFRAGGREDLARREEYAIKIIEQLLPAQLSEEQLSALVDEVIAEVGATSPKDMGKVMSALMAKGGAGIDGKLAAGLVKERLAQ